MSPDPNPDTPSLTGVSPREIFAFGAVVLAVAVLYPLRDGQPLFWDEYYHLLAARSWAADGTLSIGDGVYERAPWLSIAVGWVFRLAGPNVLLVRLAMGCVTAVWGVLLFVWVYRSDGRCSAWGSGLLFGLSPLVLVNSGMVRFYGVAGLLVLVAAMAAMAATDRGTRGARLVFVALVGLGAAYLAYRTTSLSRIWLAGLGVWLAGVLWWRFSRWGSWRWPFVLGLGIVVVGVGTAWQTGWLQETWTTFRAVPAWGTERQDALRWYEGLLRSDYPTLWTLLPLAGVLAVRRAPILASMAITVFITGLALLSGAGPKAERYLLPILPFFFVIWGLSVPALVGAFWTWSQDAFDRVPGAGGAAKARRTGVGLSLMVGAIFVLGTNPGFSRLRTVVTGEVRSSDKPAQGAGASPEAWNAAANRLRKEMEQVEVVVTSNSLQTLFHIGDYDFAMRPTVVDELSPPAEFGMDERTGRPGVGSLASLQRIVGEHRTGLIFGERWRWGSRIEGFAPEVRAYVVEHMTELDLPPELGIRGFRWGPDRGG